MSKNVLIALAYGTEEIEVISVIDLLRRASYRVTVASSAEIVTLSRGVKIKNELLLDSMSELAEFDAIVVPGGTNGVNILSTNNKLLTIIKNNYEKGNLIAAICAAPLVLKKAGILSKESIVTSHPGIREELGDYIYSEERVVVCNNLITSRGAGTSFEFIFAILNYFGDGDKAEKIANDILYK